ncbi:hypothetical protein BGZ65_001433 [Modicella reniformis]|uniref:Uncharacterized protein n=1 Tax=Modicella reniformis TaxID=1440133 RepID=A0A9P6J2C9_9FUNG|nr:hypothetical protein BGZ65_001433 [Modicella reniformis]
MTETSHDHHHDLSPTRTVPAQLDRSETTSYVIHRTFEDFERLSEMVIRMGQAIHAHDHHYHHHQHGHDSQGTLEGQGEHATSNLSSPRPSLTALRVHHPYPGLYHALLKQLSNVKANQRAFDASSTTHGFNEEGAFERVLELNQYLENVWYWLLPENNPPYLYLSHERHDIMQWFKPLAQSTHADGRQMRERRLEQEQEQDQKRQQHSILQPHGSMIRHEPRAKDKRVESDTREEAAAARSISALSLPSLLSSSSSSSCSSCSASSVSSKGSRLGSRREDDNSDTDIDGSPRASSTSASSTLPSSGSINGLTTEYNKSTTTTTIISSDEGQGGLVEEHDSSDPRLDVKIKRRMSLNHVFRSLTLPRNSHCRSQRQSMCESGGHRKMLATSASMPLATTSRYHATSQDEIYIWNTVTTKYQSDQASFKSSSSPVETLPRSFR